MEAFREYLELFEYFGRGGLRRLTCEEFVALDAEWRALCERHDTLTDAERARLTDLKALLLRDRPQ